MTKKRPFWGVGVKFCSVFHTDFKLTILQPQLLGAWTVEICHNVLLTYALQCKHDSLLFSVEQFKLSISLFTHLKC